LRPHGANGILGVRSQVLGPVTFNHNATACVLAVTTAPSDEEGRRIVRVLVERRIIACGTVLPGATSIYRWKGAVEEAREAVVLMKTTEARVSALRDALPALHPYDVPELIVVPVTGGHAPYLDWLRAETGDGSLETPEPS
jgi:periplasmic divalent cation tolerance protein